MRVQSETEITAFHGWTLRVQPAGETPARLLLLVHGWTGDENSMWVFVRNFDPHYWIIAPRARRTSPTPLAIHGVRGQLRIMIVQVSRIYGPRSNPWSASWMTMQLRTIWMRRSLMPWGSVKVQPW